MPTVEAEITSIAARLFDSGAIWTAAELLDWWNDAYKDLLARTKTVRRIWVDDVPGRVAYSYTHEWESAFVTGRSWKCTYAVKDGTKAASTFWESEQVEGVTPTASLWGISQPWERCYSGDTDKAFRFVLPCEHDEVNHVAWDDRYLKPVAVSTLDALEDAWHRLEGWPLVWTSGKGRWNTFEVFEIRTDYQQAYAVKNGPKGIARQMSGSRTYATDPSDVPNAYAYSTPGDSEGLQISRYARIEGLGLRFTDASSDASIFITQAWEAEVVAGSTPTETGALVGTYSWEAAFGATVKASSVGAPRQVLSASRQYLAIPEAMTGSFEGIPREWHSTALSLAVVETYVPENRLGLKDSPKLVPTQFLKYVRFGVLARVFGRQGEGHQPDLSAHYKARFLLGISLMRRLADTAYRDRDWSREPFEFRRSRPPRVRFPSTFERYWA